MITRKATVTEATTEGRGKPCHLLYEVSKTDEIFFFVIVKTDEEFIAKLVVGGLGNMKATS